MSTTSDTQRRVENRGQEGIARWRITSGVWAARAMAVVLIAGSLLPVVEGLRPNWTGILVLNGLAVATLIASELVRRGSRLAASLLLGGFFYTKGVDRMVMHEPIWQTALWVVIIGGALANGAWGTFALAHARRTALAIPPSP